MYRPIFVSDGYAIDVDKFVLTGGLSFWPFTYECTGTERAGCILRPQNQCLTNKPAAVHCGKKLYLYTGRITNNGF